MRLDLDRVRINVRAAATDDLMDRATVWRDGMEPEALDTIEEELRERGVSLADLADHDAVQRDQMLTTTDGSPVKCWKCHRPAVAESWGWFRLLRLVPFFPRRVRHCEDHHP